MSTATLTQPTRRPLQLCERPPLSAQPDGGGDGVAARLVAGDESAVAELFDMYAGRIMGLAQRVLGDRQLAEEVVQETILRAWRRRDTFDAGRDIEPWLFRIARNTAFDMARARSRRPRSQWGDPTSTLDQRPSGDDASDPVVATETLALRWEVRAAIDALPDAEREVVRLQHLGGLSHREIADRLGISVGTVKSRSHRAHRRLAGSLRRFGTQRTGRE